MCAWIFFSVGRADFLTSGCPQAGVRKEALLEIKRRCGRAKPVVYHVIDKPPPKKSSVRTQARLVASRSRLNRPTRQEWLRVVAVFVQGAMWQFRDFPFKVCLAELFTGCRLLTRTTTGRE